jgi:hypothetical protein
MIPFAKESFIEKNMRTLKMIEDAKKEGAIAEIALMKLCIQNEGSWKGIQEHIEKRLKELSGETK